MHDLHSRDKLSLSGKFGHQLSWFHGVEKLGQLIKSATLVVYSQTNSDGSGAVSGDTPVYGRRLLILGVSLFRIRDWILA